MITAYKLIQAEGNRELAAEVNRFIATGWEPHGSPILVGTVHRPDPHFDGVEGSIRPGNAFTVGCPTERIYAQAIVKTESVTDVEERLRYVIARVLDAVRAARGGVIGEADTIEHIWALIHGQVPKQVVRDE